MEMNENEQTVSNLVQEQHGGNRIESFYDNITIPNIIYIHSTKRTLRPRLGGRNEIEWKGMKRIILEYSSIPLFGSSNGENEKIIPLFESLSGMNGQEGTLIPFYPLKTSNFYFP